MPLIFSIISVWYGTSKSGTTGSPKRWISTFSLSSRPIGTLGSMMFGMTIIIFFIFSPSSSSSFSSSASLCGVRADLSLHLFRLVALALRHERADPLPTGGCGCRAVYRSLALCGAAELVKLNDLVYVAGAS